MTVLIEMTSRDPDVFYWPKPGSNNKPSKLTYIESKIELGWARYIRLTDEVPLPVTELEELEDELKQLEKVKEKLWQEWQSEKELTQ